MLLSIIPCTILFDKLAFVSFTHIFILLFFFHLSSWHFICSFNQIFNVFLSIGLFLSFTISLHCLLLLLKVLLLLLLIHTFHIFCHLLSHHMLFILLLLKSLCILFFSHLVLLTISILHNISIGIWLHFLIIGSVWLPILWWRNIFTFSLVIKLNSHIHCFEIFCSILINVIWLIMEAFSCKVVKKIWKIFWHWVFL